MKTDESQKARPAVIVALVAIVLLALAIGLMHGTRPKGVLAESPVPQTAEKPVAAKSPAVAAWPQPQTALDGVAPETEAALNRFGLSAKHLSPLVITVKQLPPIIIGSAPQKTKINQ